MPGTSRRVNGRWCHPPRNQHQEQSLHRPVHSCSEPRVFRSFGDSKTHTGCLRQGTACHNPLEATDQLAGRRLRRRRTYENVSVCLRPCLSLCELLWLSSPFPEAEAATDPDLQNASSLQGAIAQQGAALTMLVSHFICQLQKTPPTWVPGRLAHRGYLPRGEPAATGFKQRWPSTQAALC